MSPFPAKARMVYFSVLLLSLIVLVLGLSRYDAIRTTAVGAIGGVLWQVVRQRRIRARRIALGSSKRPGSYLTLGKLLLGILSVLVVAAVLIPNFLRSGAYNLPEGLVAEYRAVIEAATSDLNVFRVNEQIELNPASPQLDDLPIGKDRNVIAFEERLVTSRRVGWFLREVQFLPLNMSSPSRNGSVSIPLADREIVGLFCGRTCPKAGVELVDFSKGNFYGARNARDVEVNAYVRTETLTWSSIFPYEGISFAYFPPSVIPIRRFVSPFVGLSSSTIIVASIGFLLGAVSTSASGQILVDLVKKLGSRQRKTQEKKPGRKVTLHVPGGRNREVEIPEEPPQH